MQKYVFFILSFFVIFTACGKPQEGVVKDLSQETASKYVGTFSGILPCADCEGIDMELSINPDKTFSLIELYLTKESDLFLTEGSWKLSDKADYIILTPSGSDADREDVFYTLKGVDLVKLDIYARPIADSQLNYTLRRK
ncbi:MAG: copper resistance protein NlpE N-terminal domain-containing protein [Elusimicrobiota bacterium]|jgi:uncharacterized lipoprotein NlpE involved in copper resistance|nr:copper resistance protein NlpE N-terminal domain-containing protein [Elusimicrobiota bacterium]